MELTCNPLGTDNRGLTTPFEVPQSIVNYATTHGAVCPMQYRPRIG